MNRKIPKKIEREKKKAELEITKKKKIQQKI